MFKKWKLPVHIRLKTYHIILLSVIGLFFVKTAVAQTTPIDFTGFVGTGFNTPPAAGQLDSDLWRVRGLSDGGGTFGGTHDMGDFARGTDPNGVTTGGVYAFEIAPGNMTLGVQPIGADFTPGDFTLRVTNNTGSTINNLYVSYDVVVYNDQNRANSFNFSYSTDDISYTPVPALDFTSTELADMTPTWVTTNQSTTITGLTLADGAFFYLQWTGDDVSGGGSRDQFALDNIEVRVNSPTAVALTTFSFDQPNHSRVLITISLLLLIGTAVGLKRHVAPKHKT